MNKTSIKIQKKNILRKIKEELYKWRDIPLFMD